MRNGRKNRKERGELPPEKEFRLHPDTRKTVWAIALVGVSVLLFLAAAGNAGPAGAKLFTYFSDLLGAGYLLLPAGMLVAALLLLTSGTRKVALSVCIGIALAILSLLGVVEILAPDKGGLAGHLFGSLSAPFGNIAAVTLNILVFLASMVLALNFPIRLAWPARGREQIITGAAAAPEETEDEEEAIADEAMAAEPQEEIGEKEESADDIRIVRPEFAAAPKKPLRQKTFKNYVAPPLSLLSSTGEKPTTGDLLVNANVIKRTLDSFGIPVEMGEINIGPSITRYTLKPAEGVKLSRITALHQDLALALAAHPIRIEAPIPGKSLVGVEVPNKAAALVRLGSIMHYPDFEKSGALGFVLGRDVSGEPMFAAIEKMPHLLVAGATGSGKSILIHSLILSLLYKNSPASLKLVLIDPKRVELSVYERIPHLVSPVITESKKAIGVFRWAIKEMERRYELLLEAGARDIKSFNTSRKDDALPYLLIVVDELADLMSSYGRDVEGSIVRLAQMARATGIHLILSTQRPSVEVITGLIKANITSRIALQVASQIDSRTILDAAGAEKLLGRGDFLYISSDLSKPKRIQGAYITEEEIAKVADFIREHNDYALPEVSFETQGNGGEGLDGIPSFDDYLEDDDDELYDEAVRVVAEAKKASASLLQRRLKVGYARAARLLDLMEAKGVIGPGEGAKPREVFGEAAPQ